MVLIVAVDELHRYSRSGSQGVSWEPYLHQATRLGRKRGIAFIVADQTPSLLPPAVIGNALTRIQFKTVDGRDKEAIARSMGLAPQEREYLGQMPQRVAVVHSLARARPFVIAVSERHYDEAMTEGELRVLSKAFANELGFVQRDTSSDTRWAEEHAKAKSGANATRHLNGRGQNGATPLLPKELIDYMVAIDQEPFIGATERDKRLGLSDYKGNKLRAELKERMLGVEHTVSLGRRGKKLLLIEFTQQADEVFKAMKIKRTHYPGRGGLVHRFWQDTIKRHFEQQGAKCVIEDESTGKAVDVSVELKERKIAIEICIHGIDKEITNIERDAGYDEIIVTAADIETLERIKGKANQSNVRYELLSSFAPQDERERAWEEITKAFGTGEDNRNGNEHEREDDGR